MSKSPPKQQDVFIDKRVPQGQKLLPPAAAGGTSPKVNMATMGFAMSPLARRGQQVIALNSARTRHGAQTKTPLSKLLTASEMAEFQQVILGSNPKGIQSNPGEYFKNGPPTRELFLNQVSTSRIISDPADQGKASKL